MKDWGEFQRLPVGSRRLRGLAGDDGDVSEFRRPELSNLAIEFCRSKTFDVWISAFSSPRELRSFSICLRAPGKECQTTGGRATVEDRSRQAKRTATVCLRPATRLARQNMHHLSRMSCCSRLSFISCSALFFFSKLTALEAIC